MRLYPLFTLLFGGIMATSGPGEAVAGMLIRKAAVAGQFYTANPEQLRREVQRYFDAVKSLKGTSRLIISPHAGYVFSGQVAAKGLCFVDTAVRRVILIGPSHHKYFTGLSIGDYDAYDTPLGTVSVDKKAVGILRGSSMVHNYRDAEIPEHCLEVQLPFLQVKLGSFAIVPVLAGANTQFNAIVDLLMPIIDDKTLVLISSDFSHYHPDNEAKQRDQQSINSIIEMKIDGSIDACGEVPIRIGMEIAKRLDLKPNLIEAKNSYEAAPAITGSDRVVGYAAIVFLGDNIGSASNDSKAADSRINQPPFEVALADRAFMIRLARQALECAVRKEQPPTPSSIPAVAKQYLGCFVTLTKNGELRGCIGYIKGIKPVYEAIIDNARNAALNDSRFSPVKPQELDAISVEVSILTKPAPFTYKTEEELLGLIRPGVDGIILSMGPYQATFLPQVWEQLPDKRRFLEHLAMKAGLNKDDWKRASYEKYQALHFSQE